jgi:hypothetical protein
MKNNYREQCTLVITTGDDVFPEISEIELADFSLIPSLLNRDDKGNFQPLTLKFDSLESIIVVNFNYGFKVEILCIDQDGLVVELHTEAGHSLLGKIKLFKGFSLIVFSPKGFAVKRGIVVGKTKITLASPMAYGPYYNQHVWRKENSTKSDQEIIDVYNSITGRGYMGIAGSSRMNEIGREIHSRDFDSSKIISLNEDGSIKSISFAKKVRLLNGRLEFDE